MRFFGGITLWKPLLFAATYAQFVQFCFSTCRIVVFVLHKPQKFATRWHSGKRMEQLLPVSILTAAIFVACDSCHFSVFAFSIFWFQENGRNSSFLHYLFISVSLFDLLFLLEKKSRCFSCRAKSNSQGPDNPRTGRKPPKEKTARDHLRTKKKTDRALAQFRSLCSHSCNTLLSHRSIISKILLSSPWAKSKRWSFHLLKKVVTVLYLCGPPVF